MNRWSLTARWIVPVDGPPLEHGTVAIEGNRFGDVQPRGVRTADIDLGNAAILPGLVNAHTHLDLSGMRGKCPPTSDFTQWLRGVIAHRRGTSLEDVDADIRSGLVESARFGVTLLGDIAAQGSKNWSIFVAAPVRTVVFLEMLGLPWPRVQPVLETARAWLESHSPMANSRPGLSPHAPYSTHKALFDGAARLAHEHKVRLATHLAETSAELELIESRSGPFVAFLKELGVWEAHGVFKPGPAAQVFYRTEEFRQSPAKYIRELRAVTRDFLLVHCNYLAPTTPIPPTAAIVYCPRTHAAFGHPPHPFRDFLARGVRVALGTDSLASNPDLDVLAEARFVHARYPDVPGATVLRMATLSGAEALGWADEAGSITPGKSADLVVLPLPDEAGPDPYPLILQSATKVRAVLFRGQWTFGHP